MESTDESAAKPGSTGLDSSRPASHRELSLASSAVRRMLRERPRDVLVAVVSAALSDEGRVLATFWCAAALLSVALVISADVSSASQVLLAVIAAVCALFCVGRLVGARWLPRWALHVDGLVGIGLVTAITIVGDQSRVDYSSFYIWIVLFAALYQPARVVAAYLALSALLFGGVVLFGPRVPDAAAAWLILVTLMTMVAGSVVGIVSLLRVSSRADPLTGLANRRHLDERLDEELRRSTRSGLPLSVAMIDLDGFKSVNDRSGHEAGDRLLRSLAVEWRQTLRGGGDFLARVGGDEFFVVAPGSDELGIRRLADRLAAVLPDGVGCSIGTATWNGSESGSDLAHRADQKMYQSKRRHRRSPDSRQA